MSRKKRQKGWLKDVVLQAKEDVESWPVWMQGKAWKQDKKKKPLKEYVKLLYARIYLMRRISNLKDESRGWVWKRKEKIESLEYALSILDAESERRGKAENGGE